MIQMKSPRRQVSIMQKNVDAERKIQLPKMAQSYSIIHCVYIAWPLILLLIAFLCEESLTEAAYSNGSIGKANELTYGTKKKYSIHCPPCARLHCGRRASKLKCRGGIVRGICGCCPRCAALEGESCGGDWGYLGTCDRGLACVSNNELNRRSLGATFGSPAGKCRKKRNFKVQADEGIPKFCEPACTAKFCKANPRAICSARSNALKSDRCFGRCQHTSCDACKFITSSSDCTKCEKDDYRCIREFGRCIRKQNCTRRKFPCKPSYSMKRERGKFVCVVPECL